jgi:hypothetical protein
MLQMPRIWGADAGVVDVSVSCFVEGAAGWPLSGLGCVVEAGVFGVDDAFNTAGKVN